jgi:early secretory antigenic target protein ESAT-6
MAVFSADSDQILAATGAVRGTIDRLQGEAATLLAQLTHLQASWTGAAALAFQGSIDGWQATYRTVEESLAGINASLVQAGQAYAQTEQLNLALFR